MDFKEIYKKLTAKKCAFIAIFFWATAFVLTKVVLKEVDATSVGVLRYFFSSIIVYPLSFINIVSTRFYS